MNATQKQPPEVFYKKAAFDNFAIFTGKHLFWSLFSLLCFKNTYFEEHLRTATSGNATQTYHLK